MANQRNLKAFVRFDGSGRVVAGSLVLRKQKPKVGKWQEIQAYECCNNVPTILTDDIPGEFPLTYVSVRMFCDETAASTVYTDGTVANMTELIDLLNSNTETRSFGSYEALDGNTVQLTVPLSVKNLLCPDGVLSFNIFED